LIAIPIAPDEPAPAVRDQVEMMALDAQSSLLPYALVFFVFSLPVFVWTASVAQNAVWMATLFLQFAVNWAAMYAVAGWMKRRPDLTVDLAARTRLHVFGGLLWAAAVAQLAAFALGAGVAREPLLLMAVGAAAVCCFFTCASLPCLLIVGPLAAAPPLAALYMSPAERMTGQAAWGAVALSMALSLIMNRILRRQFVMTVEREHLIDERAKALNEAEQLARSKSDLLATLSHEIHNGLTGVNHVLAAAAGSGGRAAPSREQLAAALHASDDLLGVLNATLDSENAQAGRLSVDLRPFDACHLVQTLAHQARPAATARGLELSAHIEAAFESAEGAAIGDPARVRQILDNLIGNAIKYTVRGRIELRVQRAGPDRLTIEVADTGPGLDAQELPVAFAPFRRVDRTSAGTPGAGLGLSLSRDLARMMNGDVRAESAVGLGSRFWLELPFDPAAKAQSMPPDEDDLGDAARPRALRVLIAEHEALVAAMLRSVLEQLGHRVAAARDGRRAIDPAGLCDFDVMIIDGSVAHPGGPETIRAIRKSSLPTADMPIVALIGGDGEDAEACVSAGADTVMRKPVTVSAVARALAAASDARQSRRPKPKRAQSAA